MANKPGEANFFPDVPKFPSMGVFQPIYGKFDLTTYIQGASDYEIMAFLVGKYNACLEAYGTITKLSTDTITACKQLQDWINSWFVNLDVQEEINKKLDSMVADGSFEALLHQAFDAQVSQQAANTTTAWLVANVTPTGSAVVVDKSLTIEGAAADAKITGDKINDISETVIGFDFYRLNYINGNFSSNKFFTDNASGDIRTISKTGAGYSVSPIIKIFANSTIYIRGIYASQARIALADSTFTVTRIIEATENTQDKLGDTNGFYNTFTSTNNEKYLLLCSRSETVSTPAKNAKDICMVGINHDIPQVYRPYNDLYKDSHNMLSDTFYLTDFSKTDMYALFDNMGTTSKKLVVRTGETLKLDRYINIDSNTEICGGGSIDLTNVTLNNLWNPSGIANVSGATNIYIHDLTFIYSNTEASSLFRFAYSTRVKIENCKFIITGNYLNAVIDLHKANNFITIKNNNVSIKTVNDIHGGFLWVQNAKNEAETEISSSYNIIIINNIVESTGGDEMLAIYSTTHVNAQIKNVLVENNKFIRLKEATAGFILTLFANPNRTLQAININNNIFELQNTPTTHREILRIGASGMIGGILGLSIMNNVFECNEQNALPIFFYPGYNSYYNTLIQNNVYNNAENCDYAVSLYGVRAAITFNNFAGKELYQQGQNAISVKNIFNNTIEN